VEQDYSRYTAVDQAVWRFVLLQTRARLVETAHPAYREGLAATGISVERIPSIDEMNDKLSRFGWGAVCVDGFIPPRAFKEFQARGILPIAADMRTLEHLVYTPAPDIIHEAAGHAPILPDPVYASYLRRIGEVGKRAFTLPEEARTFTAIHELSEVKEDPSAGPEKIAAAEAELVRAIAGVTEVSEATSVSRLYWWTAEYGLVGTPTDYKIYGAGLLSSLGESHFCHGPSVKKLALDSGATRMSYDITKPQPQLFVTRSFEALHDVIERVSKTMAFEVGGELALTRALASRELASARFSSGAWVIGVLDEVGPSLAVPAYLYFVGPTAVAWDGVIAGGNAASRGHGQWMVTGALASGERLEQAGDGVLARALDGQSGRHELRFASGASVRGRVVRHQRGGDGRLQSLDFEQARLELPGRAPVMLDAFRLIVAGDFVTAEAGAVDPGFYPNQDFPGKRVPKPHDVPMRDRDLLGLYDAALRAHHDGAAEVRRHFPGIHATLARDFPDEWLLRWNLVESLQKLAVDPELAATLCAELEVLEASLKGEQPIATGLGYLARNRAASQHA